MARRIYLNEEGGQLNELAKILEKFWDACGDLERLAEEVNDDDARDVLNDLADEADRVARMVEDVYDEAEEEGPPEEDRAYYAEPVDVAGVAESVFGWQK